MIPTDCMTGTNIAKWKFRLAARAGAPGPNPILPPQRFAAIDGRSAIGLRFPGPTLCATRLPICPVPAASGQSSDLPAPLNLTPGDPSMSAPGCLWLHAATRIRAEQPFHPRHDRSTALANCTLPRLRHDTAGNGSAAAERSPDARPSCGTLPLQLAAIICRSYITHLERPTFSLFKLHTALCRSYYFEPRAVGHGSSRSETPPHPPSAFQARVGLPETTRPSGTPHHLGT